MHNLRRRPLLLVSSSHQLLPAPLILVPLLRDLQDREAPVVRVACAKIKSLTHDQMVSVLKEHNNIKVKILFQQLWELKVDWDDLVLPSVKKDWLQ